VRGIIGAIYFLGAWRIKNKSSGFNQCGGGYIAWRRGARGTCLAKA